MDLTLVDPFALAAVEVLQGEVGTPVEPGAVRLEQSPMVGEDVTVFIGLGGGVKGVLFLGMSRSTALRMASRMAGAELSILDELAKSAVAELANMVSGRATAGLEQLGYNCQISAPMVITGAGMAISTVTAQRAVLPVQTPCGAATLHVVIALN